MDDASTVDDENSIPAKDKPVYNFTSSSEI
jgi:hypothetical protein